MGTLLTRATLAGSLAQVRHVVPVRPDAAPDLVRRVYAQVERDFGMLAPPLILHSPAPESLAASWLMLRESLLASGAVPRRAKELAATAVSIGNACPYCVEVHKATLDSLTRGRYAAEIAADRLAGIADPDLRRIAEWARTSGRREEVASRGVPLPAGEGGELTATAVTFHYLNRMVNVFLGESPLPPGVPVRARRGMMRLFGLVMGGVAQKTAEPGASLDLLAAAPAPEDLAWAADVPHLREAFARAVAVVEEAGRRSVPEPVRELVTAALAGWNGDPPGPGRAWAAEAVSALPAAHRAAGRLALLTALASYQVDQGVVDEYRRAEPDDRALVELTSWASLAAARRIGSWARPTPAAPPAPTRDLTMIPIERTAR
ncbi:carboxymuconolactone decarboxylase family protein [Sphaerimonospora cavernae]|uniref:Carboxymuconolactone decarboxylase family protein n=1 Tax=Sphaerimonospora cavernae TaxID=1740611 RepID=A0ABV6U611_9ACTN